MTKVNWRPKVNWKNVAQKYFTIHFTCSESCALRKPRHGVNSIAAVKTQKSIVTQNKWIVSNKIMSYKWLLMAAIEFIQSTWFSTSKVNCKLFFVENLSNSLLVYNIHFQLQFTCSWSGPKNLLKFKSWTVDIRHKSNKRKKINIKKSFWNFERTCNQLMMLCIKQQLWKIAYSSVKKLF